MQQLIFNLPESLSRIQNQNITVPKLKEVSSITTNTGSVSIESILKDVISIKLTNGTSTRKEETGGIYTPADTKYVTNERSSNYNSGGYTGTLSQYVYSGTLVPADSKVYNTYRRATATAAWKVINGEWVAGATIGGTLEESYYYSSGGYSGTIYRTTYRGESANFDNALWGPDTPASPEGATVSITAWIEYNYSGTIYRPESDTRVYRYRGYVTRPAVDTRTYDYYYQYVVTVNYLEKGIDFSVKIDNNKRTVVAGWVKVNNELRDLDMITSKINGVLKEVKS